MTVHRLVPKVEVESKKTEPLLTGIERQLLVDKVYVQTPRWAEALELSPEANAARWKLILADIPPPTNSRRQIDERLLHKAQFHPPADRIPTVSHFTSWIYSLYGVERKQTRLLEGIAAEAAIFKERLPAPAHGSWDLVHNGMTIEQERHGHLRSPARIFQISSLQIRGQPLRANPDLIFRERPESGKSLTGTERIVIVEIKSSAASIPENLWANARAQLWAYSKIDEFAKASEVILVGEVWRSFRNSLGLRRSVRWRRGDEQLEKECSALFGAYAALQKALKGV